MPVSIDQMIDQEMTKPATGAGFKRNFCGLDGLEKGSSLIDSQSSIVLVAFLVAVDAKRAIFYDSGQQQTRLGKNSPFDSVLGNF